MASSAIGRALMAAGSGIGQMGTIYYGAKQDEAERRRQEEERAYRREQDNWTRQRTEAMDAYQKQQDRFREAWQLSQAGGGTGALPTTETTIAPINVPTQKPMPSSLFGAPKSSMQDAAQAMLPMPERRPVPTATLRETSPDYRAITLSDGTPGYIMTPEALRRRELETAQEFKNRQDAIERGRKATLGSTIGRALRGGPLTDEDYSAMLAEDIDPARYMPAPAPPRSQERFSSGGFLYVRDPVTNAARPLLGPDGQHLPGEASTDGTSFTQRLAAQRMAVQSINAALNRRDQYGLVLTDPNEIAAALQRHGFRDMEHLRRVAAANARGQIYEEPVSERTGPQPGIGLTDYAGIAERPFGPRRDTAPTAIGRAISSGVGIGPAPSAQTGPTGPLSASDDEVREALSALSTAGYDGAAIRQLLLAEGVTPAQLDRLLLARSR